LNLIQEPKLSKALVSPLDVAFKMRESEVRLRVVATLRDGQYMVNRELLFVHTPSADTAFIIVPVDYINYVVSGDLPESFTPITVNFILYPNKRRVCLSLLPLPLILKFITACAVVLHKGTMLLRVSCSPLPALLGAISRVRLSPLFTFKQAGFSVFHISFPGLGLLFLQVPCIIFLLVGLSSVSVFVRHT